MNWARARCLPAFRPPTSCCGRARPSRAKPQGIHGVPLLQRIFFVERPRFRRILRPGHAPFGVPRWPLAVSWEVQRMPCIKELVKSQTPFCVDVEHTVLEAARAMVERNIGAVPVLEHGRLVGIFSERDLMRRVVVE